MKRRHLLAAFGAMAFSAGAGARPAFAAADGEPLSKAFRYLDIYLGLAPAQRSLFQLVFRVERGDRPAPDVQAVIVENDGKRRALVLNAAGEIANPPSLAELKSSASLELSDRSVRLISELRPDLPPNAHLDVAALDQALDQANAGIAHIAGAFAVVAPKLDSILFPDAGTGVATFADGHTMPLPITDGLKALGPTPYFQPFGMGQARSLALAREPSRIIMAIRPH